MIAKVIWCTTPNKKEDELRFTQMLLLHNRQLLKECGERVSIKHSFATIESKLNEQFTKNNNH